MDSHSIGKWTTGKTKLLHIVFLLPIYNFLQNGSAAQAVQKPCEFDCLNGKCDIVTKSCLCSPGWMGSGCDLCTLGMACDVPSPSLTLILPQAAPLGRSGNETESSSRQVEGEGEGGFVFAHGTALPRGPDGAYSCLFGPVRSRGQWVTSSMVRCPLPVHQPLGKLAFGLVSRATNAFIPYHQDWGTSHFTFFASCEREQCRGNCLGPLCLCPHSRTGPLCEVGNLDSQNQTTSWKSIGNDSAITVASEFRTYTMKVPELETSSRVSLESEINGEQLAFDPFANTLQWTSPLGRARPYSIGVRIQQLDGTSTFLNWTLAVEPSYSAELDRHLFLANGSNARELTGNLTWKTPDGRTALNGSVPIIVHIASADSARPDPIEDIPVWTDAESPREHKFRHLLFPYLGGPEKIAITVRHPGSEPGEHLHSGDLYDETGALEWTQERVEVNGFAQELSVDENGTVTDNYTLRLAPLDGDCLSGWRFEVVEPRDRYTIGESSMKGDRTVQLTFRPTGGSGPTIPSGRSSLNLRTVFMCMPTGQNQIIRQTLRGVSIRDNEDAPQMAELNPKRLFVDLAEPDTVLTLDITLSGAYSNLLQRHNLESGSFAPFSLVWLSRPSASSWRWRLWLTLKSDERRRDADSDGVILLRGAENLALSVPYRIQRGRPADNAGFLFTLTVTNPLQVASNGDDQDHELLNADVELFTQGREQHFARSVPFNVPQQFGPLQSDMFTVLAKSRNFCSFSKLIKITPLDNALIVRLDHLSSQYFTFDGHNFDAAWEQQQGIDAYPSVRLEPAVLSPQRPFVDIVYANGPPNSFVALDSGREGKHIALPMANSTLCLGCGFRQRPRLLSTPPVPAHCSALAVPIHFVAALANSQFGFRQHFLLSNAAKLNAAEEDADLGEICEMDVGENDGPEGSAQLALRTPIYDTCSVAKLRRCRALFREVGPRCEHWWSQLPDDLLSVHTLAQFVLLSADCSREGSDPEGMLQLVKCLSSVDGDCPPHPVEAEMAPHVGGQLFNQIGHLKPYRAGISSLFPALSLVESQLASYPTLLGDFLSQLNAFFPPPIMSPFSSALFYDKFIAAIADGSPNGATIESGEFGAEEGDGELKANQLVVKWNDAVELLRGTRMDLLEDDVPHAQLLTQLKQLVLSADRLKSVTRQFGGKNPFAMFRDVCERLFTGAAFQTAERTNVTAEGDRAEQVIAWAEVRTQPREATEGEEFRVIVNVRLRPQFASALSNLHIHLRFPLADPSIKFRLGPIFIAGDPSLLRQGDQFRAEWTVLPIPEFRMTETIEQSPEVLFAFELNGERKAQRLKTPRVTIRPRPSLRLLSFSRPTTPSSNSPFSLLISAINSGYSDLTNVELVELRPVLVSADAEAKPVDFRISGIRVEGSGREPMAPDGTSSLAFGSRIRSGKAVHMTLNVSSTTMPANKNALLRNFSAVVSVNGALLPSAAQFDQRFFLIQEAVKDHSLMVVSEHSSPLPLYLFSKRENKLSPLTTLQQIEEKEARPLLNGHQFLSRVFALRRLALFNLPSATFLNGSSQQASPPIGAVFASLRVDTAQTFGQGNKLLRVSELGQGGQRQLDRSMVWVGSESDDKTTVLHFVDLDASAAVPQLIYELLFGRPENFRSPYFPQSVYQLHLTIPVIPVGQEVLSRIEAVSPLDSWRSYKLLSTDEHSPFSVVPQTGDIVLSSALPAPSDHCFNLVATDAEGRSARVPVQISVLGGEHLMGGRECQLYAEDARLYEHEFVKLEQNSSIGNQDLLLEIGSTESPDIGTTEEEAELAKPVIEAATEEEQQTTTLTPTTTTTYLPPTVSVIEVAGDSTLPPFTQLPDQDIDVEADEGYVMVNGNANGSDTLTSSSPPTASASTIMPGRVAMGEWRTAQPLRTTSATRSPLPALQFGSAGGGTVRSSSGTRRNGAAGGFSQQREGKANGAGQANAATWNIRLLRLKCPFPTRMAEMACKLRLEKPIWALICDMAKTVYRTTILN